MVGNQAAPNKLLDTSAKQRFSYHVVRQILTDFLAVSRRVNAAVHRLLFL